MTDSIRGRGRLAPLLGTLGLWALLVPSAMAQPPASAARPGVTVDEDGTVHIPAQAVPMSAYLSPEGKAYMTAHLRSMQDPEAQTVQPNGIPKYMIPFLDRQRELYPTNREDTKIGGVHVFVYTPKAGISERNRRRVLIELHGGGFNGCWPGCAELESIPVSGLAKIKVVAVDYREGPDNKFPAASEDVAAVYKELLKTHRPANVGIYGCSAGGMQTAMSLAWFQKQGLPRPGAAGIYCAGAGSPEGMGGMGAGDGAYTAVPLGEARLTVPMGAGRGRGAGPGAASGRGAAPEGRGAPPAAGRGGAGGGGYLGGADQNDPMVNPIRSNDIMSKFPPTLIITGTRGMELSGALYTHEQLVKLGVEADLHVWEGLFHGFFYNPDVPECKDAYNVMVKFFDQHLGH